MNNMQLTFDGLLKEAKANSKGMLWGRLPIAGSVREFDKNWHIGYAISDIKLRVKCPFCNDKGLACVYNYDFDCFNCCSCEETGSQHYLYQELRRARFKHSGEW